jgi:predicted molibdopterin-dependent oxidoreductase YjgC
MNPAAPVGNKAANNLTGRSRDPLSKQPELKFCAVNVTPVCRLDSDRVADAQEISKSTSSPTTKLPGNALGEELE